MRTWTILGTMIVFCIGIVSPALSDDWKEQSGRGRWWQGDYKEEYWDGPCQVKTESKQGSSSARLSARTASVPGGTVNGKKNTGMAPAR